MIVTNVLPCPSPLYLEKLGSSIFVVIFILSLTLFTITISTFFKSRLYLGNVKYSYEKKRGKLSKETVVLRWWESITG